MSDGSSTMTEFELSTISILRQINLRQVAVWVPENENWSITQPSATVSSVAIVENYIAGLEDTSHQARLKSFLAVPGPMALFETERQSQRKVIGVKLFRCRSLPMLFREAMSVDTTCRELANAHPLLKTSFDFRHYHWDTPSYREACDGLKFNPDTGRPRFRAPYEGLAADLMQARVDDLNGWQPACHMQVILDLLDLMRADLRPSPSVLDNLQQNWPKIDRTDLPHVEMLTQLLATDELLNISAVQHLENKAITMQRASVEFLPSRYGSGYRARISGFFDQYESDGWVKEAYDHTNGVAVEPAPEELASSAWLRIVRRRLLEQGVVFIPQERVEDYLKTRGMYWRKHANRFSRWLHSWIGSMGSSSDMPR